jgi:hypothetical protein
LMGIGMAPWVTSPSNNIWLFCSGVFKDMIIIYIYIYVYIQQTVKMCAYLCLRLQSTSLISNNTIKKFNTRLYEICFQVGNLFINTSILKWQKIPLMYQAIFLVQIKSEKNPGTPSHCFAPTLFWCL